MKMVHAFACGLSSLALSFPAAVLGAEGHVILAPDDVEYGPAPPVLPQGAELAVLYGDPNAEGPFAMRIKLPDGYAIPPHTHPAHEIVTVIAGTFKLGHGGTADEASTEALPAGSFFAFPPETVHYAFTEGETVVQITTTGPWGLTYVNPEDDPRTN